MEIWNSFLLIPETSLAQWRNQILLNNTNPDFARIKFTSQFTRRPLLVEERISKKAVSSHELITIKPSPWFQLKKTNLLQNTYCNLSQNLYDDLLSDLLPLLNILKHAIIGMPKHTCYKPIMLGYIEITASYFLNNCFREEFLYLLVKPAKLHESKTS